MNTLQEQVKTNCEKFISDLIKGEIFNELPVEVKYLRKENGETELYIWLVEKMVMEDGWVLFCSKNTSTIELLLYSYKVENEIKAKWL